MSDTIPDQHSFLTAELQAMERLQSRIDRDKIGSYQFLEEVLSERDRLRVERDSWRMKLDACERAGAHMREVCESVVHWSDSPSNPKFKSWIIELADKALSIHAGQGYVRAGPVLECLREIESHCPCGFRPESPSAYSHAPGCPVEKAICLLVENKS